MTPFISIFKQLNSEGKIGGDKLVFANKTKADIIHEKLFVSLLGKNFINILSDEKKDSYAHGQINKKFLEEHIEDLNSRIYLCGPQPMMDELEKQLANLGGGKVIIKEEL